MSVTKNNMEPLSAAQRCFVAMNTEGEKPAVEMANVIVHALFALCQMRTIDPAKITAELQYGFEGRGEIVLADDDGDLLFTLVLEYTRTRIGRELGACCVKIGTKSSPWVCVFDTHNNKYPHPADVDSATKEHIAEPAVELWTYIKNRLEREHGLY